MERRLLCENDKAKSDLISVVSHDLRTPLTSITGYLEILTDRDAGLTVEQRRLLGVVQRNADRLLAIVSDLLFISRAEAGKIELSMACRQRGRAEVPGYRRVDGAVCAVEPDVTCAPLGPQSHDG